ncbi:hypothetical protein AB0C81_14295 [Streptomyces roseoverticillatus]|uniref:NucA/NucB deoxyribonuclease domain-containing protein n=1 Tax=Streptomyces roseoverticillatus TaxID=66429 RepID=UPI0033EA1925
MARAQGAAWTCVEADPRADLSGPSFAPVDPKDALTLCKDKGTDRVVSNRHAYCTRMPVRYVLLNDKNVQVGEAHILVWAAGGLDSYSGQWTESIVGIPIDMDHGVTGVDLAVNATCSGMCSVVAPAWSGAHVVLDASGDLVQGTITYRSTVAAKTDISHINITYTLDGAALGATGVPGYDSTVFDGPTVRCDATIGDKNPIPGCIVMGHMPNVTFSRAKYHGAAVAYEWAQKKLTGKFGDADHPLSRYIDPLDPDADKRRALTCDRAPDAFPRGATGVPNDSCDEYPFARSWQGGNPGTQCIDITPRQVGGVWDISGVTVDRGTPPNAPCIRAHVDKKDNTAAGGELGRAVQADRIVDSEWYQVIITP